MKSILVLLIICTSLLGCREDAKSSWDAVIKKCSDNQLNGNTVLYFGPSNNVGPGSIWRPGADGGFRLRYSLDDMPDPKQFIEKGNPSTCDGSSATNFGLKASIGLTTSITPGSIELANDFQKAKNIQVKTTAISWDIVKEGPYESYIKNLSPADSVRDDLGKAGRLVLYRALRVSGFSATLEFTDSDTLGLKGKYSGTLSKQITGDVGAELSASWTSDNKLVLTSTGDFYIAGELVPFKAGGFSAGGGTAFGQPVNASAIKFINRDEDLNSN
jgi:hypothetical protein